MLAGIAMLPATAAHAQTPPAAPAHGEAVLVKRAAELREMPGEAGRSLATLAPQTAVVRTGERQGPWIRVTLAAAPATAGWVHMFDVGAANTQVNASSGGNAATGALRGLTSFFNKGSAQQPAATLTTSTVGIRGLGAEDIANAQPNVAAVGRVEGMRVDAAQARQFALEASLTPRDVPPLPAPPSPRTAAPATPAGNFNSGNTP